jgi:hypothetical protein
MEALCSTGHRIRDCAPSQSILFCAVNAHLQAIELESVLDRTTDLGVVNHFRHSMGKVLVTVVVRFCSSLPDEQRKEETSAKC